MPPIVKDSEAVPSASDVAVRAGVTVSSHEDTANRPQPVALEIPVNVNGARALEGSEKREPFSESTKTVLVFGNGAVIRLTSPVAPGQLLFLTNEKTRKEVVCQVVKSKNYRNVSGYVELEFTEPVVGFWGLRFPGDRIGQQPTSLATVAPARTVPLPSVVAAIPVNTAKPLDPKSTLAPVPPSSPLQLTPASLNSSRAPLLSETQTVPLARAPQVPIASALPNMSVDLTRGRTETTTRDLKQQNATPLSNKAPSSETAPVAPSPVAASIVANKILASAPNQSLAGQSLTEPAKQKNALLHEQLSAALFSDHESENSPARLAAQTVKLAAEDSVKTTQNVKLESSAKSVAQSSSSLLKTAFDSEEVKIPSWLEPLARNAAIAAPSQQAEGNLSENDGVSEARMPFEPLSPSTDAESADTATLGNVLLSNSAAVPSKISSNKGIWVGLVAAGLLLAAGGSLLFLRPANPPVTTVALRPTTAAPTDTNKAVQPSEVSKPQTETRQQVEPPPTASISSPVKNAEPASRDKAVKTVTAAAASQSRPQAEAPPEKRPTLGEVHLSTPTVRRHGPSNGSGEAEPALTITGAAMTPSTDATGTGLVTAENKQPVAPVAPLVVGGDVKPARMLRSTSPVYPGLARSQHISGDVRIDALIDANGRVSSMKVVSGPTLLHQAAMDALRQWRYQPATLDGKAVPMHLVVTIQFRMQQ